MMRQESPSPNSTLSSSALAAAKPPTPTSSPKLRRRTMSGGSGDQSIVRQHLEIEENDSEEKSSGLTKSKRSSSSSKRDSPSELHFSHSNTASGNTGGHSNATQSVPIVHDKRRSVLGSDSNLCTDAGKTKARSARLPHSQSRETLTSSTNENRLEGNKCVKRTQSLKEQLVKKFSTVFTQSKNSSSSSSSSAVNNSHSTASENQSSNSTMATSQQTHAQPVISGSRRSRIPQLTQGSSPSVTPAFDNSSMEHDIDTYKAELSVIDHSTLYSPRQLSGEDRTTEEHAPLSYDISTAGNQLRVVKDQEATPFRSHTVDRCGVVVPSGPTSTSTKCHDPESERTRQASPNPIDSNGKKTPRVIDFEKLSNSEFPKSLTLSQWQKMNRSRPGSLRHNVLPDKKLLKDKANSNENLSSFAGEVTISEPLIPSGPLTPQAASPIPIVSDRATTSTVAPSVSLVPRPPMNKRPSTDSDDNSAPEFDYGRAAVGFGNGSNASLPPRGRLGMYPKVKKGSGTSAIVNGAPVNSGSGRSAPILIGGSGTSRRDNSPCAEPGILLNSARPDDSSDGESLNEDGSGGGNTSDGDISPKGSTSGGVGTGERTLPTSSRRKSSSLERLNTENPTVPKIRQPSARRQQSGIPGSPPKSVTWNLVPDVVKYDKDQLAPDAENGYGATNGSSHSSSTTSSSSSRHHHHSHHHSRHRSEIPFSQSHRHNSKMRHAASDERLFDARKGIANSTLIAVHESFLEQMTMLLKEEMQLLEEVKQEKKSMTVYREVMQKILNIKAKTVKQMQDILEQSET